MSRNSGLNGLGKVLRRDPEKTQGNVKLTFLEDSALQLNGAYKLRKPRPSERGITSVVSPAVVYDFKSQNSIDAFLTMNGTHDYFSYAIVPCIAFAQEYITLTFNQIAFGDEDEVVLPGAVDYACRQYIHLLLPGIVGTHSVSGTAVGPTQGFDNTKLVAQTTYPYVMGSQNGAASSTSSTTAGATGAYFNPLSPPVNGIIDAVTTVDASNICNSIADSTSIWLDSVDGVHGTGMSGTGGGALLIPAPLSALPGIPGVHILDRTLEEQMYMYLFQFGVNTITGGTGGQGGGGGGGGTAEGTGAASATSVGTTGAVGGSTLAGAGGVASTAAIGGAGGGGGAGAAAVIGRPTSTDFAKLPLTFNMYAHYCYGAGYRAIESLVMVPGFGEAEILDYHYIYMWEELSGEAGRRDVYTTGCAPTRDELIRMSLNEQHLYINIPWWFTYAYENPLVLTTTQLTDMTFSLQLAQLSDLIVVSDAFTIPVLSQRDENAALWVNDNRAPLVTETYDGSFALQSNCIYYPFVDPRNPQDIQLLDHKPRVVAVDLVQQVIYLEDTLHEQLRQQAQSPVFAGLCVQNCSLHQRITNYDGYDFSIPMSGDNPVIEYIVFVTLEANEYQNDWFDSSRQGPSQGWGSHLYDSRYISNHEIRGRDNMLDVDPIQSMMLEINNNQRWHRAPAAEYRVMQQAIHHSSVVNAVKTRNYYHNVCFATYPEEGKQYSGSSNLGKVGVHRLNIQFDESLATLLTPSGLIQSSVPFTCHVYGRVFAVWDRDSKRLSGPRYALKFDLAARV